MGIINEKSFNTNSSLYLKEFPIREVQSVEYSYDGSFSPENIINLELYEDYFVNIEESAVFSKNPSIPMAGYSVIPGTSNIRVTYTAGFKVTPSEIITAIAHLVDYMREEQFTPRKSIDGVAVENLGFRQGGTSFPSHIARVIELYRVSI